MISRGLHFIGICLAALSLAFGGAAACAQEELVTLPQGYAASDERYPVVYLLPEDGYAADESGIAQKLTALMQQGACAPMIIVRPSFEEGMDLHAQIKSLVERMDGEYRTIADREHRVLMGTGTGGYLSYVLGLTQMDKKVKPIKKDGLFDVMVSIRGDFVSEGNPWYGVYGDMYDLMEGMNLSAPGVFDGYYTYLDAPVNDALTNMQGSTNDIGALFIGFTTGSANHEFTVRPGEFDEAFLAESVSRAADRMTKRMFPAVQEETVTEEEPADETPVVDGETVFVELMGNWKFQYVGADRELDAKTLTKETAKDWPSVRPGRGHWTKGFGNISDKNVISAYGDDYFDYFITGNAYYVKTFDLPQNFTGETMLLSAGYVDDRCEVFLNGVRVGATGMDENGMPTGDTTWAQHSLFEIDPSLLIAGGENTMVVRAWNDLPYGAGGWYGGPVGLYSKAAYDQLYASASERFYEETFTSSFAAKALLAEAPVENEYLIYLPKSYDSSENRRYPTVYLLHQFNSDHTSYSVDKVNELFDKGMEEGLFDEMIVVIPNSDENSWWAGDWEKMIVNELIPHIDEKYRTIRDARYRLTAGCSMGGQGAMAVALRNPACFSGAVSFFGAFSYGGMNNPNMIAAKESAAYMDYFSLYFICGNQDSYGFGVPAIELNQRLTKMGVEHRFFIENGGHDGSFYLPNFLDAFHYIRGAMMHSSAEMDGCFSGKLAADGTVVRAEFAALDGAAAYVNVIPASSYTPEEAQALNVALTIRAQQEGREDWTYTAWHTVTAESLGGAIECELPDTFDQGKEVRLTLCASVFDRVIELSKLSVVR